MNVDLRRARKKPVEIEYMVWPGGAENATPVINWILENGGTARYVGTGEEHYLRRSDDADSFAGDPFNGIEFLVIDTREGYMRADQGYVIIRGVEGEFYGCDPAIFTQTYDIITEA